MRIFRTSKYKRFEQYFWDIFVNSILASYVVPNYIRKNLFRLLGMNIGRASIHGKCYFGSNNFNIGNNSYINRECLFDNANGAKIEIGNNCAIGYRVCFYTTNHNMDNPEKRGGAVFIKDIYVRDGCWIGANSIILSGVKVGEGCVIASGAVVTTNCDNNSLYAGVPAKKIRGMN